MANEIQSISFNIGATTNKTRPVWKIPSGYGGVTIVGGQCIQPAAGTQQIYVVEMDSTGATVGGTLGSFGTVFAAETPQELTVTGSRSFIDAGNYVGIKENNVGTTNTITIITLNYLVGRGEY